MRIFSTKKRENNIGSSISQLHVLVIGLKRTGKTELRDFLREQQIYSYVPTQGLATTACSVNGCPLKLTELGGALVQNWCELLDIAQQTKYGAIMLMVRSDFGPKELETSRAALFQLYFKRPALKQLPVAIVQRCVDDEDVPICAWATIKAAFQIDLMQQVGVKCALFRLVSQENSFVKSLDYIFDWLLKHGFKPTNVDV